MIVEITQKRLLCTGLQDYDHVYLDAGEMFFTGALRGGACPCCMVKFQTFEHELPETPFYPELGQQAQSHLRWLCVDICPQCGWWNFSQDQKIAYTPPNTQTERAKWATLTYALQTEIELGSPHCQLTFLRDTFCDAGRIEN